jgi:capsular polysaccharide export protein
MSTFLFLSLAKHQGIYFRRLLDETDLQGTIATPRQLPWPRPWQLPQVAGRIEWSRLIEEKCRERDVKRKYRGLFYRLMLRAELAWVGLAIKALLDRERPDALVMWNGSHRYCQLLVALKPEKCRTFFVENGLLPNTTTLDPQGVNYHNSVPRAPEFFRQYGREHSLAANSPGALVPRKPKNNANSVAPVVLPESYVFIPFQDDRDSQVRLFSPWIADMCELFALAEKLVAETGITVVCKEHPSSRESYPELHQRATERLFFANGNSTQQLIEASQFVVTLNSTVGLESILLGKPVLTLGMAFFNIEGLVVHADSEKEFIRLASTFPRWNLDPQVREGFLAYMKDEYCVPGRWQEATAEHLSEVARRMKVGK